MFLYRNFRRKCSRPTLIYTKLKFPYTEFLYAISAFEVNGNLVYFSFLNQKIIRLKFFTRIVSGVVLTIHILDAPARLL